MNKYFIEHLVLLFTRVPRVLIALIIRCFVKKRLKDGSDTIFYTNKSRKITILMLDSARYRGDIDILTKSDYFRILHVRQGFQNFLVNIFLKGDIQIDKITNNKLSHKTYGQHLKTIKLFREVLKHLYNIVNIDCVTTVHYKYIPDYYWTLVSEELLVPYICLYRECNLMSPVTYDRVVQMMMGIGSFHGSRVIVHNKKCKEVFFDANFASDEQISIAGVLRMDELNDNKLQHLNDFITNKKKVFTLFYFPVNTPTFCLFKDSVEKYNVNNVCWEKQRNYGCWEFKNIFFTSLHIKILEMASVNPDIDFVIKTKREFTTTNDWKFYKKLLVDSDIDFEGLNNYRIEIDVDTHSLINKSNVVCGLQSTTTAESIFMEKKVLVPLFYGFRSTKFYDLFPWRKYEDLYCVVEDIADFEMEILSAFNETTPRYSTNNRKNELFKDIFGFDDGESLSRYEKIIIDTVKGV